MSASIPAADLSPGDVLMLSDYPIDLIDVDHSHPRVTWLRWSVCEKDVMCVSKDTLMTVLNYSDV
jgi:hypothetical protein